MITFKQWMTEESPTNVSSGTGVRGFGDVTGNPAGDISNYAATNAATSTQIANSLAAHINSLNDIKASMDTDTKNDILHNQKHKVKNNGTMAN